MLDRPVRNDPDNAPTGPGEDGLDRTYRYIAWLVILTFLIGGFVLAALD